MKSGSMNVQKRGKRKNTCSENEDVYKAAICFSKRLRTVRNQRELTRMRLAEISKISITTLENYEYGKNRPSFEAVVALCRALEVTPNYLFGWDTPFQHYENE